MTYIVDVFGNAIADTNPFAVKDLANHPGEDIFFDRQGVVYKPNKLVLTASGLVKSGSSLLCGYLVTVALSAAAITIYNNTSAAGEIIGFIAASAPVNTVQPQMFLAIPANLGIYASFAGTGTVAFFYL